MACEGLGGHSKLGGAKIFIFYNFENFFLKTGVAG